MGYILQASRIGYSEREEAIFALLPKDGSPITSDKLVERLWPDEEGRPFHDRVTAMGAFRSLKEKVERNKEGFTIKQSKRSGPKPLKIWIEARPNGKSRKR